MITQANSLNIVDAVLFQCRSQPPAMALCAPGAQVPRVSYRRLEQFINNSVRKIQPLGFRPRSIVGVSIHEPALHVAVVLALMRLGMVSTSISGAIPGDLGGEAIISDRPISDPGARSVVLADLSWIEGEGRAIPAGLPPAAAGDLCRLILTSGTTGAPKAVGISHRLLFERAGRHLTVFGNRLPACSRIFCDMNLRTSLGFQFLIYTLLRGGAFFFAGDVFQNTLEALEEYKVDCAVASPGGIEALLRLYEGYALYQSKLKVIVTAGDLLSSQLSKRIRSRLCSHVINVYGSTEASITATAPAHVIADEPGAVGFVTPGVSVEIVDQSGCPLPPFSPGLIRVKSAFSVDHYLGANIAAESPFRDGWFYPGDLGAISPDGLLVVKGRQKTVLSIGGDKISPEAIEASLTAYDGVDECAAFSVPNQLGNEQIWVALVTNSKFNEQGLHEHCRATLPVRFLPSAFVLVDKLARNAMGKIERESLRELADEAPLNRKP